jgi:protein-serine/threonine kinase
MNDSRSHQHFADPDRPTNPLFSPHSYLPFAYVTPSTYDQPPTTLRGGTLLHKGFYDLLAMIPTPSPSRFFWGTPTPVVAGPRYEDIPAAPSNVAKRNELPPPVSPVTPRKGRRISKDMVSNPTGFVYDYVNLLRFFFPPDPWRCSHLVHASDADQLEALLTRWGPDGMGKLGG